MKKTLSIIVANGVNLDLLGKRNPAQYGSDNLQILETRVRKLADALQKSGYSPAAVSLKFFQTNDESEYLRIISKSCDGLILNPGAWTHTSLALADRLEALGTPYVEVHLSNLSTREKLRKKSLISPAAKCVIFGGRAISYEAGLVAILSYLKGVNLNLRDKRLGGQSIHAKTNANS